MNHLETILLWSTFLFEIVLCRFVFVRKAQRLLPLFATYVCVCLTSTIALWLSYRYWGFNSNISYFTYWGTTLINAVARSLAIAELCRYGLRAYRGIWALVWRVLAILSVFLLGDALVDAWGQPHGFAIYGATLDRNLALASIIILALLFFIRKYYGLSLDPLQRSIAAGICFICAVDVIANTVLRNLLTGYLYFFLMSQQALWPTLKPRVQHLADLWSTIHLFSFMFSMGIWCYALRKPVPSPTVSPVLLPAEVYREMSPAINARLATLNERMLEMLKP